MEETFSHDRPRQDAQRNVGHCRPAILHATEIWYHGHRLLRVSKRRILGVVTVGLASCRLLPADLAEQSIDVDDRSWVAGAVVPMAIPITVGGGVIAVVATISAEFNTSGNHLTISLVALAMSTLSYLGYAYAPKVADVVGDSGLEIMTRIFGIILAAIGFQVLFAGLLVFFPGLGA